MEVAVWQAVKMTSERRLAVALYLLMPFVLASVLLTLSVMVTAIDKPLVMAINLLMTLLNAANLSVMMAQLVHVRWALALRRNHGTVPAIMSVMYRYGTTHSDPVPIMVYWDGRLAGMPEAGVCLTVDTYWWMSMRVRGEKVELDAMVLRDMLMDGQDVRTYLRLMYGAEVFEVRELTTGERQ